MGQTQNPEPRPTSIITQGYKAIRKTAVRSLSAQVNLFQRQDQLLSDSCYPLDAKSSQVLLQNNKYYSQRINFIHSNILILYFCDFNQPLNGTSVKNTLSKLPTLNNESNKRANVNTICSLNIFQKNCKNFISTNSQLPIINLHLYHQYEPKNLEIQIEQKKLSQEYFKQKDLWILIAQAVSVGRALVHSGFKEPNLSPISIKIDKLGSYKFGEWQFTHFYQQQEDEQQQTYFYEEGETFLKPVSSRIKNENLKAKRSYNILNNYYWAPQGTFGMQNIISTGRKSSQNSFVINKANNQIFSLGMTLLHMCLMRPLYQSQTYSQKKIASFISEAVSLRQFQGLELSHLFIITLQKMLAWDPNDRIGYEELNSQINTQRSIRQSVSIYTQNEENLSSMRSKKLRAKSIIFGDGIGSGSIDQGSGDMQHPLQQSQKLNVSNTMRSQMNFSYQNVDVTIKRQRREWQKFESRIEQSEYKVKQVAPCRQLFKKSIIFTLPAQTLFEDEEDIPNRQILCNFNPNTSIDKQIIDFQYEANSDICVSSVENSIKLLDISNIKAQDENKSTSKKLKNQFIKLDIPQNNQEQNFVNLFLHNRVKSVEVHQDSLLLKSSVKPFPSTRIQEAQKQANIFTSPELLALIKNSTLKGHSRQTQKETGISSNISNQQKPLDIQKQIEAELSSSIFVKQSFAKGYYEGGKVNGERSGYGTFYYNEGGKYCGDWENNQMHGKGTLYYADGRIAYQGDWRNDALCGKGILYNQKPNKLQNSYDYKSFNQSQSFWVYYEGNFHNDDKWGRGTLLLSNGEKYEGSFRNDLVDGKGVFYTLGGKRIIGQWQANQLVKIIRQQAANAF